MDRVEPSSITWTASPRWAAVLSTGAHRFRHLRSTVQIVASWAVLVSIGFLYVPQAGTALSSTPASSVAVNSSWEDVSRDVRALRLAVASFASPTLSAEALERIRPDAVALSGRLSELSAATGAATVEIDELRVEMHRTTLLRLTDQNSAAAATLTTALDALIGDADRYATMERAVAISRIEDQSVTAIRTLGAGLLAVAAASVIVALALIGFGDGLGELERRRRLTRR
jgi:hypothetical protein